jgi:hypothetical protein
MLNEKSFAYNKNVGPRIQSSSTPSLFCVRRNMLVLYRMPSLTLGYSNRLFLAPQFIIPLEL